MSEYTLYSFFRSSSSGRLRLALNFKNIPYKTIPVNLLKNEHKSEAHRALNPSGTVPLLISPVSGFRIGQSVAALEYLEEAHPAHPLLPPATDLERRAIVRTIVNIATNDIQPVTSLRIMARVESIGGDRAVWAKELTAQGLAAIESVASEWAGQCSVGDDVTMADVCLLPVVWNAEAIGIDTKAYPTIMKVVDHLSLHPAVVRAHYLNQPDTPAELRAK